jgi:hypothetical protein
MPKVSERERNLYFDRIAPYRPVIEGILKREKELLHIIQQETKNAAFKRLDLTEEMLDLASHYIILNGVSLAVLKVKNEDALNDARQSLYKAVIYLEQVVTGLVDAAFSEYEEKTAEIASMNPAQRYLLVRKIGLAIQLLKNAYGDNSKWKWSFVELEGRYAATAKNILDMKKLVANTDPRSPYYEPAMYHFRLVRRLLPLAADRYREKYELSTNRIDDYKRGIEFLSAQKRILAVMGNRDEGESIRKKIDIWSAKLALDMKKQQETSRKNE